MQPDLPLTELWQEPGESHLLKGNVPQPSDWLRVWRSCRTPESFWATENRLSTEHYIQPLRSGKVSRKQIRALVEVMSEVLRERKRNHLREASSISLSLDDRQDYRLLRFRCDLPAGRGHEKSRSSGSTVYGILGLLRREGVASTEEVEDFDDDKSRRMAESVLRAIEQLCTPAGGATDRDLYDHVLRSVRHYMSDGGSAVQRAGAMLQDRMPNLVFIGRDPAHMLRIAFRDPLEAVPRFQQQWQRLFKQDHALIPDIMNSELWRAKLVACQRRIIDNCGAQGGGMERVLRHMRFAAQRFESYGRPLQRYCCLVRAIAMLLAHVAGDSRNTKVQRERAEAALQAMTPKELITAGITADYTAETLDFLRLFDVDDHDPAETPLQLRAFCSRMDILFNQGYVLVPPERSSGPAAQAGRAVDEQRKTYTQIVIEQCQDPEPITYPPNKVFYLWTAASMQETRGAQACVISRTPAATQRVLVKLCMSAHVPQTDCPNQGVLS